MEWTNEQEVKYSEVKRLLKDSEITSKFWFYHYGGQDFMVERLREEVKGFSEMFDAVSYPSKELFTRMKDVFKKYLDTHELNYNLLAAWTLGTYFHNQFETFPLLTLMARKQSGKTRTLKLVSSLALGSDGSVSTSITETFLFRRKGGAVFFDEMESLGSKEKGALRETMNAIYKRGNKIVRYTEKKTVEGKDYVEQNFYPYYPLGIANIYGFGDVLADRSLQLILQRSNRSQSKLIEDFATNPEIQNLKEELSRLSAKLPQNIFSQWNSFVEQEACEERLIPFFQRVAETNLSGRPLEIFFPLFLIGDAFGVLGEIIDCSRQYIERLENELQANPDDLLNEFIVKRDYEGYVGVSQILYDFKQSLEEPEEWMNSKWLGRALKRLGLISKKRSVNGKAQVILTNTTNSTNAINTTNTTNTTKEVGLVGLVGFKGLVGKDANPTKTQEGYHKIYVEEEKVL